MSRPTPDNTSTGPAGGPASHSRKFGPPKPTHPKPLADLKLATPAVVGPSPVAPLPIPKTPVYLAKERAERYTAADAHKIAKRDRNRLYVARAYAKRMGRPLPPLNVSNASGAHLKDSQRGQ